MSSYAFYHSTKQNHLIESNIHFISKIKNRILEVEKIVEGTDRIIDKGNKVIDATTMQHGQSNTGEQRQRARNRARASASGHTFRATAAASATARRRACRRPPRSRRPRCPSPTWVGTGGRVTITSTFCRVVRAISNSVTRNQCPLFFENEEDER